ncbi:hypothetical protein K5M36_15315 [Chromobacterium vaccinii]|nr:hypothetical protein [Chromobacterium vaccinii]NHQ80906.1 hypothetical protein [Chromobacterium vaccinii]
MRVAALGCIAYAVAIQLREAAALAMDDKVLRADAIAKQRGLIARLREDSLPAQVAALLAQFGALQMASLDGGRAVAFIVLFLGGDSLEFSCSEA